jgi:hypothetical protein
MERLEMLGALAMMSLPMCEAGAQKGVLLLNRMGSGSHSGGADTSRTERPNRRR